MQALGGPGKRALLGDGHEAGQVPQPNFHDRKLWKSADIVNLLHWRASIKVTDRTRIILPVPPGSNPNA
jgi:hypothetical protein